MKANLIFIAMMLVSSTFALHLKQNNCSKNFEASCKNIKLENGELYANCKQSNGREREASLELTYCISFNNGKLGRRASDSFSQCSDCWLNIYGSSVVITCTCSGVTSSYDLARIIGNNDSELNCKYKCVSI